MFCSQCGTQLAETSRFCYRCGVAIEGLPAAEHPSPRVAPARSEARPMPTPRSSSYTDWGNAAQSVPKRLNAARFSFEPARWRQGDFVVAASSLVLLIALFLPWYTVKFQGFGSVPGSGWSVVSTRGWMYLVFVIILATFLYLLVRGVVGNLRVQIQHWQVLAGAAGLDLLLTGIAFGLKPSAGNLTYGVADLTGSAISSTWTYGAYVGLVGALGAVIGVLMLAAETKAVPSPGQPLSRRGEAPSRPEPQSTTPAVAPGGPSTMSGSVESSPDINATRRSPEQSSSTSGIPIAGKSPSQAVQSSAMTAPCPECGASRGRRDQFCGSCGQALATTSVQEARTVPNQPSGDALKEARVLAHYSSTTPTNAGGQPDHQPARQIVCSACGVEATPGTQYCGACGARF